MLLAGAMLLIAPSCKKTFSDFLDKAPGVDINENTLFSSRVQLDYFLATIYKFSVPSIYNYGDGAQSTTFPIVDVTTPAHPTCSITDEGDASEASFIQSNVWNTGNVTPGNITTCEDRRYFQRWVAMRQIAIMLKRVDEVPDADDNYKKQVKAEVKVLRALSYLEMVKRYGGVPIINQVFDPGVNITNLVPRASLDDCFKFIINDCDEALPDLPPSYSATQTGRITSLAALAVKARTLLYAASQLFNRATPYLSMANADNNKLICYGSYDINRWKLAADAAKAVIDAAPASGIALVDDPTKRNPAIPGTPGPITGNYSNAWELPNNTEVILAYQGYAATTVSNPPVQYINPTCFGTSYSGITVPLNFIKKYEKLDGTPQTWDAAGGTDLLLKYGELDPRFKQTIGYTGSYWNPTYPVAAIYQGGAAYNNCLGGNWMHKLIPRAATTAVKADINDITLRLNEFYLDYAEAINEFSGPTDPLRDTYVNLIRARSGMPPLPAALPQDAFRTRVRNERAVELAYEEHRFWDIRRWMIAETDGVMQGAMQGLKITQAGTKYTWLPYTFETRTWYKKEYLHPFPQTEILKSGLIQNPGY